MNEQDGLIKSALIGRLASPIAMLIILAIQIRGIPLSENQIATINSFVGIAITPDMLDIACQVFAGLWGGIAAIVSKIRESL